MSDNYTLNIDPKKNKNEEDDNIYPDHNPLIPYNYQKEKEKEEIRKKATELRKKQKKFEAIIVTENGEVKKASELTREERIHEIIRCKADPIYFIETYLTIFDQTQGNGGKIVQFKLFEFQKELIENYKNNRFVVANKYRQAGVSTTTCAYIAWYIMFNTNRQVAIVANKLETAKDELMADVVNFIESCPSWLRPKTGKESEKNLKNTQKLKIYDNGSKLGAYSASGGLRGYTPTLLFWDEVAWTEKSYNFWTSAKPTLQTGGNAIMVSTPSGLDAVFYKTFMGARNNQNNFKAVEIWWFNDPRYNKGLQWVKNKGKANEIRIDDQNWDSKKRIAMMIEGWEATSPWFENEIREVNGDMRKIAQELLCSFLGSGDNFIAEIYLKRIEENEIKVPLRQEYTDLNVWIWEDPLPAENYIMALDASPGHGEDYSSMNILKIKEIIEDKVITKGDKVKKVKIRRYKSEQVAEYYGKISPQLLAEIAYIFGKKYNNAYCVIDITGGYGIQTVEKLFEYGYPIESIHYAEVSHKPSRDRLMGYIKKGQKVLSDGSVITVDLIPGFFIGNNRASVLLEMQRAIHLEDVIIRSIRLLNELKTFVVVPGNRIADHKRSFHDDSIMSLAIGLYVLNYDKAKFKQSKTTSEKMLNAIITVNDIKEIGSKHTYKPVISPNSTSPMNPYITYAWLFEGLDKKKNK